MSIIRLAFVTSVMWMPRSAPPVRFHSSQLSIVPARMSPVSAAARRSASCSRSQPSLPPEKYVAGTSPVFCRIISPRPSRSSAATTASVLVSCHTIAFERGRPVRRSQTTTVSRWLVTPTAARSAAARPALASAIAIACRVCSQISVASCSIQPTRGRIWACWIWCLAISRPPWSKTMNRVLVVPWSIAATRSPISCRLFRRGLRTLSWLRVRFSARRRPGYGDRRAGLLLLLLLLGGLGCLPRNLDEVLPDRVGDGDQRHRDDRSADPGEDRACCDSKDNRQRMHANESAEQEGLQHMPLELLDGDDSGKY